MAASTIPNRPHSLPRCPSHLMPAAAVSVSVSRLRFFPSTLSLSRGRFFSTHDLKTSNPRARPQAVVRAGSPEAEDLKENWLASLSCPFERPHPDPFSAGSGGGGKWVLGVDPDANGALALLKDGDEPSSCSAQVFDTPHLQVMVGKRARKRLDARSIVQLLHSFGAPHGTTAYIEQSTPFPQDGKQGWWCGGFTYGLWIGILVSSGFSVVPVSSRIWKDYFQLSRNSSSKDDSRKAASDLFPSLSSTLKRKKDHGRAEALLIAAYGKGLRLQSNLDTSTCCATPTPALAIKGGDSPSEEQRESSKLEPINIEVLV